MTLAVGSDHAAFVLRGRLVGRLREWGHDVREFGAVGTEAYDYPDAADLVSAEVLSGQSEIGVLLCGTGIGVSIRANRHPGIRAAVCCTVATATLARNHNHANILCIGARTTDPLEAEAILAEFLSAPEDHDARHERRVSKLDGIV